MIIFTIILAIVGVCLIAFSVMMFCLRGLPGSEEGYDSFIAFVLILGLLFLTGAFWSNSSQTNDLGYEQGYKQGQVDAAKGIQKYHLTTQPDKWELKEKK